MKIEAKDLRIGNWVENSSNYYVVGVNLLTMIYYGENNIQGIPLTPEILEKAGFEITDEDYYFQKHIWINKIGFKISVDDIDFVIDIPHNKTGVSLYIEYLHQLQNLYYALTGQELNIEL